MHLVQSGLVRGWARAEAEDVVLSLPTTRTEPYKAGIDDGREALARGAWAEARARFGEALAQNETPQAYEGLGIAARYELDADAAIDAHQRGYRLARSQDDAATAALLAIQLGFTEIGVRANWIGRA